MQCCKESSYSKWHTNIIIVDETFNTVKMYKCYYVILIPPFLYSTLMVANTTNSKYYSPLVSMLQVAFMAIDIDMYHPLTSYISSDIASTPFH